MGVSTFGNPRINAYLQLPAAYRSLSRPSSAPDAKAFTLRSYSLELPVLIYIRIDKTYIGSRFFELSEFLSELFVQGYIALFRCEKTFYSPFALCF